MLTLSLTAFATGSDTQQVEPVKQIQAVEEKVKQLEGKGEVYQELREEIKNYRDYMQKESERVFSFLNVILVFFSIQIPLSIAILVWFYRFLVGESKQELKESIDRKLSDGLDSFVSEKEEELKKITTKQLEELQMKAKMDFNRIVDAEVNNLESKINTLKQLIDKEEVFTATRILLIASDDDRKRMEAEELKTIRERGIKNITSISYDQVKVQQELVSEQYDILIFYYKNKEITPHAVTLAELLNQGNYEIPYIVYNYCGEFLDREDKTKIEKYLWHAFANFPISLTSYLFSLAYAFNKNQSVMRYDKKDLNNNRRNNR